jgi:outer membrane protein assembly factor BamB
VFQLFSKKLVAIRVFATLALIQPSLVKSEESAQWSQWRGPQRDGALAGQSWPDSLKGAVSVWEKTHQPSYSGPVLVGDIVFTTETIDKQNERVTAYSLASGELIWTREWPGSMAVPFFAAANGDWIRSTPVCNDKHLIVLGMRDVLVSLDPKTGEEQWRFDFPEKLKSPLQPFGSVCSPLIEGDAVYVQAGVGLVKLSLTDGSLVWKSLDGSSDMMSGGAFSSPIVAEIAGEKQLIVQTREELCGVSLDSGEVLWREEIEAFRGMNILTPLVIGNRVFTAAHSGKSQLFEISRDANGAWNVNEVWNQKSQGYMSSPVVVGDHIYLHQKSQRFSCLSVDDGSIRWTSEPYGKYWSMIHNGDKILALDETGDLLLIRANPERLEILDTIKAAENAWSHIALHQGKLIIRDLSALKVFDWK